MLPLRTRPHERSGPVQFRRVDRDHRMHEVSREAAILTARSESILWAAKIKMMTRSYFTGCGQSSERLTRGLVPKLSHPSVGGNGSPWGMSHSCPIFTSSWDLDCETAIWDSPAWSYNRKRLGSTLHRQRNVFRTRYFLPRTSESTRLTALSIRAVMASLCLTLPRKSWSLQSVSTILRQ